MNRNKFLLNVDCDYMWYIYNLNNQQIDNAEKNTRDYVDDYANHGVTDLILNTFCQASMTPSKFMTFLAEKRFWKTEGGIKVDYSEHGRIVPYNRYYFEAKIDPVKIILDEAKKKGMRTWVSIRMNDCHIPLAETNFGRGELFYYARENGLMIGCGATKNDYYKNCLNYEKEYIRDIMLKYIEEQVFNYEFDGLELDFLREIFCFDTRENKDFTPIMNEFITNVRNILDKKEKIANHKIKLMIRVGRDIKQNYFFGIDCKYLVDNGIVDAIVVSPRWQSCDSDLPFENWKDLVKGTKTELYAGAEVMFRNFENGIWAFNNDETVRALTYQSFSNGFDGMYLFNYFIDYTGYEKIRHPQWLAVANFETGIRRHVMTYQEYEMTPKGVDPYTPLPFVINSKHSLTLNTGTILNAKTKLIFAVPKNADITVLLIKVDNLEVKDFKKSIDSAFHKVKLYDGYNTNSMEFYESDLEIETKENVRKIDFVSNKQIEINYLEFKVTQ